MSRILVLVPIIIIVQPLSFGDVTGSNQKNTTFTVYIVPHTFKILFLLTFPAKRRPSSFNSNAGTRFLLQNRKKLINRLSYGHLLRKCTKKSNYGPSFIIMTYIPEYSILTSLNIFLFTLYRVVLQTSLSIFLLQSMFVCWSTVQYILDSISKNKGLTQYGC